VIYDRGWAPIKLYLNKCLSSRVKRRGFPLTSEAKKDSREVEKGWKSDTSRSYNPSVRERQQWHADAPTRKFLETGKCGADWICDRMCSQLHVKLVCVVEVYRIIYRIIYRKYAIIVIAGGCWLLELIRTRDIDIRALIIQLYILYSTLSRTYLLFVIYDNWSFDLGFLLWSGFLDSFEGSHS